MSGVLERTLAILEKLAAHADGLPLARIADEIDMPRSAAHRLLLDLARHGYVRQSRERGDYVLTTKLVSLGLGYLKRTGVLDLCQPIMDRLAQSCGELVRLGIVDVDHLTWVGKAQGARSGLRYDPDMGSDAQLACSSSGLAWLATLDDAAALELVARQGFPKPEEFGPHAITTPTALLAALKAARRDGYAMTRDTFSPGLSAIATAIVPPGKGAVGVLAIAGPTLRLTEARMEALAPDLRAAAEELAAASGASPLFDRAYVPAA